MKLPTSQTSIPLESCFNSRKQEEGKLPRGAGFSRPRLFGPVWASGSGNPLWHESHKLDPESQQKLTGWGAATTAHLVHPGSCRLDLRPESQCRGGPFTVRI